MATSSREDCVWLVVLGEVGLATAQPCADLAAVARPRWRAAGKKEVA